MRFRQAALLAVAAAMAVASPTTRAQEATPMTLKQAAGNHLLIGAAVGLGQLQDPAVATLIDTQFNCLTGENAFKPSAVHPQPDRYTFEEADKIADWAKEHGLKMIGHNLLWHQQCPKWMFEDETGKPLPRDKALANLKAHIDTVVKHFHGRVIGWDVVNEALSDKPDEYLRQTPALKAIGPDYLVKAFEFAHAADPQMELYYNDYSTEWPGKREKQVRLIKELKAAGVPLTAVGIQGHWLIDKPEPKTIEEAIDAFSNLKVKVMITELDVDVLPRQHMGADVSATEKAGLDPYKDGLPADMQKKLADRYGALFAAFMRHRNVITRITFWGVYDGASWLNFWPVRGRTNWPLLWDRQLKPKPAFTAVIEALEK